MGNVAVAVDVQGFYATAYPLPDLQGFVPIIPTRALDTRSGVGAPKAPLGAQASLRVKVTGLGGVPVGASAVMVNLTGITPTVNTRLYAYGFIGAGISGYPTISLSPGQVRPVLAVLPVTSDGYITVFNAAGTIDVLADIQGYYFDTRM
ncbi:hypothetical protein ABH925_003989 [Streptacidiphilus sp. EB129]